jgi:transcription termination factor NusB
MKVQKLFENEIGKEIQKLKNDNDRKELRITNLKKEAHTLVGKEYEGILKQIEIIKQQIEKNYDRLTILFKEASSKNK